MSGLSEMLIEEPWMRRVRADGGGPAQPAAELGNAHGQQSPAAMQAELPGWDPYEVWLHRIQRPRKPRGGAKI